MFVDTVDGFFVDFDFSLEGEDFSSGCVFFLISSTVSSFIPCKSLLVTV